MYAGTTFRKGSGRFVGVHQKIDRAARRCLNKYISKEINFPGIKDILHFEGSNGPDAVKYMKPSDDEPWHFINPENPDDRQLIEIMNAHIINLAESLKSNNSVRASFEAAWFAHAIVDGLTPAHHYPFNEKIEELWGKPHYERSNLKDRNIIHGVNAMDTLSKNWEYWGAGGLLTAHIMYEMGVASTMASRNPTECNLTQNDINYLVEVGFEKIFIDSMKKIYQMKLYDEFRQGGWNRKLVLKTKRKLIPEIIKVVALGWYQAALIAGEDRLG